MKKTIKEKKESLKVTITKEQEKLILKYFPNLETSINAFCTKLVKCPNLFVSEIRAINNIDE